MTLEIRKRRYAEAEKAIQESLAGLRAFPRNFSYKALRIPLILTVLYILLGCAVLYPVPLHLNSRIVGGGELGGWLWRYWLMKLELRALWVEIGNHPLQFFLQMISLGRFPETGNIADLYFVSLPLEAIFGHPAYYNLKCLLILVLNALAGYALAKEFTSSRTLAFIGGTVAGFNSFVFLELYQSGLRQAILWWLLLSILFLERVLRGGRARDALLGGITFGMAAAFYWFYGLFLAMYAIGRTLVALRPLLRSEDRRRILVSCCLLAGVGLAIAYVFAYPYIYITTDHTGALPEVQYLTPFPTLEALRNAPDFPHTLDENLLSSLKRVLFSSWSLDYLWNPLHPRSIPLALTAITLIPALVRIRKEWFWLLVAIFYWLHTGGPYLQLSYDSANHSYVMLGDEPLKLPYAYTFQYIPLMSRLFAPYRSGALLWIALAVLSVRNLEALRLRSLNRWLYPGVAALFLSLYFGQYFFDHSIVQHLKPDDIGLSGRGLPIDNSVMRVHPFYEALAKESGHIGVIELPLGFQQDLINYYQVVHQKKLFEGWALPGALPPALRYRQRSTHPETRLLMWIVEPDTPLRNTFAEALRQLNEPPYVLPEYGRDDQRKLVLRGFKYLILHERGCYLLLPERGHELYKGLQRRLSKHLGQNKEFVEFLAPEDPEFGTIRAGVLGEWASSAIPGAAGAPTRFHMTVYRMPDFEPGSAP